MYKALYSFKSRDTNSLSFGEEDKFTILDSSKDPHWWLAQKNGSGEIGYVPANYLNRDEESDRDVVLSIDRAIEAIHQQVNVAAGGKYSDAQKSNLQKLYKHRQAYIEQCRVERSSSMQPKRQAPTPPNRQTSVPLSPPADNPQSPKSPNETGKASSKRHSAPPPPCAAQLPPQAVNQQTTSLSKANHQNTKQQNMNSTYTVPQEKDKVVVNSTQQQQKQNINAVPSSSQRLVSENKAPQIEINENIGKELVELVRRNTSLSHELSQLAVATVCTHIKKSVPQISQPMQDILSLLESGDSHNISISLSQDAKRLEFLFGEIAECKDDSQQRSWFLHEDEETISGYLEELVSILNNAEPNVCKTIVSRDLYQAVNDIVLYYQMETRISLRLGLLQVFGALCALSATVISELLHTVLPMELTRDLMANTSDSLNKQTYSALVLTMILSTGEPIPIPYYEHMNAQFIQFLLDNVEAPPGGCEQIQDLFVNLILAFNLHFELPSENVVMKIIGEIGTAKHFSEKLMLLVNRGDDPVRMFDHQPEPPNSLLKFMSDLYSSPSTSNLLYTNDAMVLVDIVLRNLSDMSAGDKLRTEYLSLIQLMIQNSNYSEHQHRKEELQQCFRRIGIEEEDRDAQMDTIIVNAIWKDFPDLFPHPGSLV